MDNQAIPATCFQSSQQPIPLLIRLLLFERSDSIEQGYRVFGIDTSTHLIHEHLMQKVDI